jgi:hypothetical protein
MTTILRVLAVALLVGAATPVLAQVPDLSPWDGVWFKTKLKQNGLGFRVNAPGVEKDKGAGTLYIQLHFDPGAPGSLAMDIWIPEDTWRKESFPLLYLAGT